MAHHNGTEQYALKSNEGDPIWFLGTLMTVKAGEKETGGTFSLIECDMPAGFGPPPHIHQTEDEAFYILEGEVTVFCGRDSWLAEPGSFVFLPKGVQHRFVVGDDAPARMLQLTLPARFEHFATEVGEPATERTLPPPSPPDIEKLVSTAKKYDIDIMVPSPGH